MPPCVIDKVAEGEKLAMQKMHKKKFLKVILPLAARNANIAKHSFHFSLVAKINLSSPESIVKPCLWNNNYYTL